MGEAVHHLLIVLPSVCSVLSVLQYYYCPTKLPLLVLDCHLTVGLSAILV